MQYDAVVFDNDGVLTTLTGHDALRRAMRLAFEDVGVTSSTAEHVDTLLNPDVSALRSIAEACDVDPGVLWEARERAAVEVQYEELRAGRKTLYDDVHCLEELAVPRAIVSNNQHETIRNIVEHFGLEGFDPWYGREPTVEGIKRKKPTPYYIERAIDDLACENPLYVGDSRVDVVAADALGIDSAFLRREHREGYDLRAEPTHEVESLEGVVEIVQ